MRSFSWMLFALLLAATSATHAADRPNIVFILADDLGYTDLACYGSGYYETPNIDRLAADGMRFTQGYTCGPNCQPTRATLMSGQYGPRTGVYTVGSIDRFDWKSRPLRPVDNVTGLPLDKVTIAEALKKAGYATGMFGKWHLGSKPEEHPSRRGFDEAIASQGQHFAFKTDPKTPYPPGTYLADFLTFQATNFIRRHKDQPFFLYLPHFAVHGPHEAKKDEIAHFRGKPAAGGHSSPVYAAMISSLDKSVGRVRATLEELGLTDNTIVIFSSDNGGVGGYVRAGVKKAGDITDNAPLRGGKGMLYEGGIRVPYIYSWPGHIGPGTTNATPINSVDLYPTLLALAGVREPEDYTLDGTSYADLLLGKASDAAPRKPLFWHFPGYLGAGQDSWRTLPVSVVREGDWKLMEFLEDGRLELYRLNDDVSEAHDLAKDEPERVRELHQMLVAWREAIGAPMPTSNDNVQPAQTKKKRTKQD
ncbi:MAG: sulfatase [Pirellulales bacterium]|nr:sulfatase [Pirellulales bacterium]